MKARDFLLRHFDRAVLAVLAARRRRRNGSLLVFFLLVFALSLPFWLIGVVTAIRLLPGLPISSLMFVCPAMAAAILVYGTSGTAGVRALLRRAFDYEQIGTKVWYAPTLILMPGMTVLTYGLMRLMRAPLPRPELPVLALPAMLLAFFVAALEEELGWWGYATDPLQERWGALRAGILLASVSAAWHVVPLVQADRTPGWIAWWCLFTVAGRVLIVWIYNNAGKSVLVATLFHATNNASWQLFPNFGSHWDPSIVAPIVAFAAAAVTFLWGPNTLARYRYGPRHG
jgi:membrane protease YdiL (CAAX protease family)